VRGNRGTNDELAELLLLFVHHLSKVGSLKSVRVNDRTQLNVSHLAALSLHDSLNTGTLVYVKEEPKK